MRVVHLIPVDLARGAQTYLRALLEELRAGRDEHLVATLFGTGLGRGARDAELDVEPGPLRRAGFDPRAAARLRRELARVQPDVVVSHGGEGLKYVVPARPASVPILYYKIGMVGEDLRNPLRRAFYRQLTRRVAMVAAVSEEVAAEARRVLRVPGERVVVIPNGRDPERYRPPATRPTRPRLVFVGALTQGKRPELFLHLVRALRARDIPFDASVVGDGPRLAAVRREAAALGVEVLGRRHDVPEILAASSVLVLTSASEGMPGVLIEAGLSGIPVVTTAVSGARAVVEDDVTGFVVGLDDGAALVETTERLLTQPELRRRMGEAARDRCLERFTVKASARRWQAVLEGVVGGHPAASRPVPCLRQARPPLPEPDR